MFNLCLTPAAISYLTQFILALLLTGYFVIRLILRASRPMHMALLTGFFACFTLLTFLFLASSMLLSERPYALFEQNIVLSVALILLLQFAYHFPAPLGKLWERRLVLGLSSVYALYELAYAVFRFRLIAQGRIIYRPDWADYPIALALVWAVLVLARQSRQNVSNPDAARAMARFFLLPCGLALINVLKTFHFIQTDLYQLLLSTGVLITLTSFTLIYLNYQPETTSFMVKLSGATLVTLLSVLGVVGWIVTPVYAANYRPVFLDRQTLRFSPNALGGYEVQLVPFQFESDVGRNLELADGPAATGKLASAPLDFEFVFYGRRYSQVYVTHDGTIAMGQDVTYRDYVYRYGSAPLIFALLIDLLPEAGGGVFARQTSDRLIVTWQNTPAFSQPEAVFTFQAVLHSNGVFEITYNGLPERLEYRADHAPWSAVWLTGSMPGISQSSGSHEADWQYPQHVNFIALLTGSTPGAVIHGGPRGMVQDYYLDFRRYLHTLLWPLAILILVVSALSVFGLPFFFYLNLVQPLNALVAAAQQVRQGRFDARVTPRFSDEIGFLTESFNVMAAVLNELVTSLETRVTERTQALSLANAQLRQEALEREKAQSLLVRQQRDLAALTERERIARELHDSLGQDLGYISAQSQAARALFAAGKMEQGEACMARLSAVAAQMHLDIREYIAGVKSAALLEEGLGAALEHYVRRFNQPGNILVELTAPALSEASIEPLVRLHILRIVQEALTNARKHAQASRVWVTLTLEQDAGDQVLQVIVRDDGVGFDLTPSTPPSLAAKGDGGIGHFGLGIMRERAQEIGGSLRIESAPGQGIRVIVRAPLAPLSPLR